MSLRRRLAGLCIKRRKRKVEKSAVSVPVTADHVTEPVPVPASGTSDTAPADDAHSRPQPSNPRPPTPPQHPPAQPLIMVYIDHRLLLSQTHLSLNTPSNKEIRSSQNRNF